MTGPEHDEIVVEWDEFEQATDLLVSDRRPKDDHPRDPVSSR